MNVEELREALDDFPPCWPVARLIGDFTDPVDSLEITEVGAVVTGDAPVVVLS